MKRRINKEEKIPPEFDYKFVEEYIARKDTPWLVKIKGINLLAKQREERDRRRKR
jgi:hypothetical protein